MYKMKPLLLNNKWYVEVETKEFGKILLLNKKSNLPIPITFESEEEAFNYIKNKGKK